MATHLASDKSIEFDPNLRLLAQDTVRLAEVLVHRTLGEGLRMTAVGPLSMWHNSSIRNIAHSFYRIAAGLVLRAKEDSLRSGMPFMSFDDNLAQLSVRPVRNALYREVISGSSGKLEVLNIFEDGEADGDLPYCLFPLKILQLLMGREVLSKYAHHAAERSVPLTNLIEELKRLGIEEESVKRALKLLEQPWSNNPYGLIAVQGHASEGTTEEVEGNELRVHLMPSGAMFWAIVSTSCEYLYSCAIENRRFCTKRHRELQTMGALSKYSRDTSLASISPDLLRVSVAAMFLEDEVMPAYKREADALRNLGGTKHAAAGRAYVKTFNLGTYQDLYVTRCIKSLGYYLERCAESDKKQREYRDCRSRLDMLEEKAAQFETFITTMAKAA
jgi:hypothetical protein